MEKAPKKIMDSQGKKTQMIIKQISVEAQNYQGQIIILQTHYANT